MVLSWWGKGLLQICMHHWTVYAKVEFSRFPLDVRTGGSIPQLLNLNSEMNSKILQSFRGPFHNFWSWTQKWIQNFFQPWGVHSTTFEPELRNEFKIFPTLRCPFHNFWSWTQKWILKFFKSWRDPFQNLWSWTQKWT